MARHLWIVALIATSCARQAPPFVADAGAINITRADSLLLDGAGSMEEWLSTPGAIAEVESRNRQVRVLRVVPDRLQMRVGDTLSPLLAIRVSGRDASGKVIPDVTPLYGPFWKDGAIRPLPDGRWLATRVGRGAVLVRALRITQPPDRDTALVRTVRVDVVP